MEGTKRPVMTLNECTQVLRSLGVRTSPATICNSIENGVYPFGVIKSVGPNGRRSTEIYRVKFDAWLREMGMVVE